MPPTLPTQIYKPKDFSAEVERIKKECKSVYNYAHERYEYKDKDGNVFEIDWEDGTISVN